MTEKEHKTKLSLVETLVTKDRNLMKELMKEALEEVLEGEMTEHLGAPSRAHAYRRKPVSSDCADTASGPRPAVTPKLGEQHLADIHGGLPANTGKTA